MQPFYPYNNPGAESSILELIRQQTYPCLLSGRSESGGARFGVYDHLGSFSTAREILRDINDFLDAVTLRQGALQSFIALFRGEDESNEMTFELLLWQQLQALHEADDSDGRIPPVSDHRDDRNFHFHLTGRTFYVTGLHPESSSPGRRSPVPTLVFTLHMEKQAGKANRESLRSGSPMPISTFTHTTTLAKNNGVHLPPQ